VLTIEIKEEAAYRNIQWKTIEDIFYRHKSPASTCWYANGQKSSEEYWANGNLDRNPAEGPAYMGWHDNEQKSFEYYRVNGNYHRNPLEGPAINWWYSDGEREYDQYWVNGKWVNIKDYQC